MNSFAFHVIKTLLQIVGAVQEPYYSDTSLNSIMYAKPDTFDKEDNTTCSFLNLQIMHVLQYSRCLHSIKHLTKTTKKKQKHVDIFDLAIPPVQTSQEIKTSVPDLQRYS